MKKLYAKIGEDGSLMGTVHSKVELDAPWILLDQDFVSSEMVWDEDQGKFITPPQ
jgi:hypothetical protein